MSRLLALILLAAGLIAVTSAYISEREMNMIRRHFPSVSEDDINSLAEEEEEEGPERTRCNFRKFVRCGRRFNRHLGLGRHATIRDLGPAFKRLLDTQGGKRGWTNLCRWARESGRCQGHEVYPGCYNLKTLTHAGVPLHDAYAILEWARVIGYECGPGFKVVANDKNYQCTNRTERTQRPKMRKCAMDFQKAVKKTPCKASQGFITCFSAIYKQSCGAAVASNSCNVMKVALALPMPKCQLKCPTAEEMEEVDDELNDIEYEDEDEFLE